MGTREMNHTFKEIKVKNIKLYNIEECHSKIKIMKYIFQRNKS